VEASTQTDPVAEAREAQKTAQAELTSLRNDLKKAKGALTKAQAAEKSAGEGDDKKALAKETKTANAEVDRLTKAVATGEQAVAAAKENVTKTRDAEKARKAEERKNRPKKAPLTLSQRRALLKLGDGAATPSTDFNRLPYEHLVSVGLAQTKTVKIDGPTIKETTGEGEDKKVVEKPGPKVDAVQYSLTDAGKARVSEINPKWKDWKPAATAPANGDAPES
jgi:hypothetical protein